MDYLWSPWRMKYIQNHQPAGGCVFCHAPTLPDGPENLVIHRGQNVYVILNRFPYTSGHMMVVPYLHVASVEELDLDSLHELTDVTMQALKVLRAVYRPEGFNVGLNIGSAAGAGIAIHAHQHIVPRWTGDANFMTTLGETRVLPEELTETYLRVRAGWE